MNAAQKAFLFATANPSFGGLAHLLAHGDTWPSRQDLVTPAARGEERHSRRAALLPVRWPTRMPPAGQYRCFPLRLEHPGGAIETRVHWPGRVSLAVDSIMVWEENPRR